MLHPYNVLLEYPFLRNNGFLDCYFKKEDMLIGQRIPWLDPRFNKDIQIKGLYSHMYILATYINLFIHLRDYSYDTYTNLNRNYAFRELPYCNLKRENFMALDYSPIIYIGTTFFSLKIPADILYSSCYTSSTRSITFEDACTYEKEGIKICKNIIDKCDNYIEYCVVQMGVSMEEIKSLKSNKSILSYREHFHHVFKQHFSKQDLD